MDNNIIQKLTGGMIKYLKACGFDVDVIKENYNILGKPAGFRESLVECLDTLLNEFETDTTAEDYYVIFDGNLNLIIEE